MKRNNYIVIRCNDIEWKIAEGSPNLFRLKSNNCFALVNPLCYNSDKYSSVIPFPSLYFKFKGEYYFSTNCIVIKKYCDKLDHDSFMRLIVEFIKQLRIVSKQSSLNPYTFISSFMELEIKDLKRIKCEHEVIQFGIRSEIYSTKINWDFIREADKRLKDNFQIPIYIEILTDALNGLLNHDYRKAILFSSIAIESMLAIKLDNEYNELINQNPINRNYRISESTTSKGKNLKDPIYLSLRSKTNFSYLLHECPLYIWNRSILLEDEKLYASAKKLYSTRNKIAHWGEPDNTLNDFLEINYKGAIEAFEISKNIFKWAEIEEFDNIEIGKFIEFK